MSDNIWDRTVQKVNDNELSLSDIQDCIQEAIGPLLNPDERSAQSFSESLRQKVGGIGPMRSGGLQTTDTEERNQKTEAILKEILLAESLDKLKIDNVISLIETHLGSITEIEKKEFTRAIELRLGDELESLREGENELLTKEAEHDRRQAGENILNFTPKK